MAKYLWPRTRRPLLLLLLQASSIVVPRIFCCPLYWSVDGVFVAFAAHKVVLRGRAGKPRAGVARPEMKCVLERP